MRFSLATLILITLWLAFGGAIFARWQPWYFHSIRSIQENEIIVPPALVIDAPDGKRYLVFGGSGSSILDDNETLHNFLEIRRMSGGPYSFPDNNTVELLEHKSSDTQPLHFSIATYKRRFPEWWWGHFYRPEVWLFLALTIVLVVRAIKHRRATRMQRAEVAS